jgi:hypothetical protein
MARILGFKSLACQGCALHGLGHWQRGHDPQVPAVIDGFLAGNPDIDARLIRYANSARCGCVLQASPVLCVGKIYGTKPFAVIEITRPKA